MPPAGPQAQGWTGKSQDHCLFLAEVRVHPRAIGQDRPSRLGPAGEGRSDSGVLHLHPRGQARYPEGGRRREDETPAGGVRVRANTTRRQAPGRRAPRELATRGCRPVPPLVWLRSPRFFTPYRPTRTRQDLPCTSAGDPAPRVSSSRRQIRGERRAVCPQDVPGPPLAANGRHHQQPVNLKLARASEPPSNAREHARNA